MGLLNQIDNTPAASNDKAPGEVWKHIALRVTGYDLNRRTTKGVDIATGEMLEIKLDGADRPGRDDLDEWSKTRFEQKGKFLKLINNKAVVAGDESEAGVIIFEAVRPTDEPGLLESRWAVTASHSAEESAVHHVMARPIGAYQNPGQLNPNMGMEVVRPLTAAPMKDVKEILEAITSIVASSPFTKAVVRAQDEDGKIHASVVPRHFTDELRGLNNEINRAVESARAEAREKKVTLSFDQEKHIKSAKRTELAPKFEIANQNAIASTAENFLKNDGLGKLLGRLTEDQMATLKLETFALEMIYPGAKYKESMAKETGVDNMMLRRDWKLPESSGEGFGFADTFLAIRIHEEGGSMITKIRASSTRPLLYPDLESLPTPNITPDAAPVVGAHAATGSGDEVPASQPDDGIEQNISEKLQAASRAYTPR